MKNLIGSDLSRIANHLAATRLILNSKLFTEAAKAEREAIVSLLASGLSDPIIDLEMIADCLMGADDEA